MSDLSGELRAEMLANGVTWSACQRLMTLGISGRFVAELGAACSIGQARIVLQSRGRFWEPSGPDARLLLGCFEGGDLIDIAAVSTSQPDQVALRSGLGWCLGGDQMENAERAALAERFVRLRVFADPMEWLRGFGEGICVIDWAAGLSRLRGLGERVTLEASPALAVMIRAKLERGGLPLIANAAPDGGAMSLAEKLGRAA